MKNLVLSLTLVLISGLVAAQKSKKQDVASIMSMCGCYEVSFNFAETFAVDTAYKFKKNYSASAVELVIPIEEGKDKIVLQHLLVINDTLVIKHWRQDWLFENTTLYEYNKENRWDFVTKNPEEVSGQWTQKVYQVDDSPRYEGTATWLHVDGKHFWENTADAPLPRRERTKRNDYNVMARTNRHEITEDGWIHGQDNAKVVRNDGEKDVAIAWEKGWNTYKKTEDSKCQAGAEWWVNNQAFWTDVRAVWDEVFALNKSIEIEMKVEKRQLSRRLYGLAKKLKADNYDSANAKTEIRKVIQMHIKDLSLAAN